MALNEAKRSNGTLVWYQSAMKATLSMEPAATAPVAGVAGGAAPSPLETVFEPCKTSRGEQVTAIGVRWRVGQQVCDVDWMQERGVLGPRGGQVADGRGSPPACCWRCASRRNWPVLLLAFLPSLPQGALILALPTLTGGRGPAGTGAPA